MEGIPDEFLTCTRFQAHDSGPLLHLEKLAPANLIAPHDDDRRLPILLRFGVSASSGGAGSVSLRLGRKVAGQDFAQQRVQASSLVLSY